MPPLASVLVEPPTIFEPKVSMKTVKGLGVAILPSLLLRVDQIIE
jgi:hypothetical protein